jgi:leucyl/phenylalanyl-tRNA--protein transferase
MTQSSSTPPIIPPDLLMRAYRSGIFPMADARDDAEIFWVEPKRRAILPLDRFRCSHSLAKVLRRDRFRVTCNTAFDAVVSACAAPRPAAPNNQDGESWISHRIQASYAELHRLGLAHSIECWHGEDLVGGLYGVGFDRVFCGESMFSRMTDASKVALAWLVAALRRAGAELLDCQFITDYAGAVSQALGKSSVGGGVRRLGSRCADRCRRGCRLGGRRLFAAATRLRGLARRGIGGERLTREMHRAVLHPHVINRVLDHVERRRIQEQPAREHFVPRQLIAHGGAFFDEQLREGTGFLRIFPGGGTLATRQPHDGIAEALRFARFERESLGDVVTLVEQAQCRHPVLERGCAFDLHRPAAGATGGQGPGSDRFGRGWHVLVAVAPRHQRQGTDRSQGKARARNQSSGDFARVSPSGDQAS